MRLLAVALLLGAAAPQSNLQRYLTDPSFRRASLESSLTTRTNHYAAVRLQHYATGDDQDWDRRPLWNPQPIAISSAASQGDPTALRALGEKAFFAYPAQLAPYAEPALKSRAALAEYGLWFSASAQASPDEAHAGSAAHDRSRRGSGEDSAGATRPDRSERQSGGDYGGGLVQVALADGSRVVALSCATCHVRDGIVGAGNHRLDLGRLMNDGLPATDPALKLARQAWGRGRVDVTTADGSDPVLIPDLRPIRWQTHLHHGASVRNSDELALAVRIETLIITAHGGAVRPPREIALGLALYLRSLGDQLPPVGRAPEAFAKQCAGCHQPPGYAGPPIAADHAGTDPFHARSAERGTGRYRVPSLRGLSTRGGPLLHDGSAPDLHSLLERFSATDRTQLLSFLATL